MPDLPGCIATANNVKQKDSNVAIRLHLEDRLEAGEEIPQFQSAL